MTVAEHTTEMIDLVFTDWEGARRAHLEAVPRTTTVGQIVGEAVRAMGLPFKNLYQAVSRGRELPHSETLEELGIETDDQLELVREISAG